jgi:DNA-binding transcriptional regulator LsrR (DeoR family)
MYARDPNVTKIAQELGVHRSTIHRRLDEAGVQEAIVELRTKLDTERNTRIEEAQDMALELLTMQLKEQLKNAKENPGKVGIADTQKLMQIAEKLGTMKKNVKEATLDALAKARQAGGTVDWDTDVAEDD